MEKRPKKQNFLVYPETNNKIQIDLISKIDTAFDKNKIRVKPKNKKFSDYKKILSKKIKSRRLRDILRSNCMNLREYLSTEKLLQNKIKRDNLLLFTSRGNTTYVPAIFNITKDFCRLLGYYISEGNITTEKVKRGIRNRIQFHFHKNEHKN